MKVAVVGAGISGLTAAWLLARECEVHLFESDKRLGGNAHTVDAEVDGVSFPVDTGFMVYNEKNYPSFVQLLKQLGVESSPAEMGFGLHESGADVPFEYGTSSLDTMFAQRWRIFDPQHWRMLLDILKFNKTAQRMLAGGLQPGVTLSEFFKQTRVSKRVVERYILPLGGAIFCTSIGDMLNFPAASFLRFMQQNGLLHYNEPLPWLSIRGGSRAYVEKLAEPLKEHIYLGESIMAAERVDGGVQVRTTLDREEFYHHLVIACPLDGALKFLKLLSAEEHALLSCFYHHQNRAVLHTDVSVMPHNQACWASHNVNSFQSDHHRGGLISMTYWLNQLQDIPVKKPVLLSLNPIIEPQSETVLGEYVYSSPQFNVAAAKAMLKLKTIQGKGGFWYCGAYQQHGTHEDGVYSAMQVAKEIGVKIPWDTL